MGSTIWFDRARDRFWRVPNSYDPPPGDLEVRSLAGASRRVQAGCLDPWLLPRDEARQAVVEELRDAARHTAGALGAAARDAWHQARHAVEEGAGWAELERRLGRLDTWLDRSRAQEAVDRGRTRVQETTRQARDTVKRASRVASSAVRSARAMGKVVLDHPELAETASRWAEALGGREDPAPRRRDRTDRDGRDDRDGSGRR
jgi:hypothetical protein